jgi:hypothetical protein
MKLKSFLFAASIFLILPSCSGDHSQAVKIQKTLDSLAARNALVIDSLNQIIESQNGILNDAQSQYDSLLDSIKNVHDQEKPPIRGPKISDKPQGVPTVLPLKPKGDPIEIPIKK